MYQQQSEPVGESGRSQHTPGEHSGNAHTNTRDPRVRRPPMVSDCCTIRHQTMMSAAYQPTRDQARPTERMGDKEEGEIGRRGRRKAAITPGAPDTKPLSDLSTNHVRPLMSIVCEPPRRKGDAPKPSPVPVPHQRREPSGPRSVDPRSQVTTIHPQPCVLSQTAPRVPTPTPTVVPRSAAAVSMLQWLHPRLDRRALSYYRADIRPKHVVPGNLNRRRHESICGPSSQSTPQREAPTLAQSPQPGQAAVFHHQERK